MAVVPTEETPSFFPTHGYRNAPVELLALKEGIDLLRKYYKQENPGLSKQAKEKLLFSDAPLPPAIAENISPMCKDWIRRHMACNTPAVFDLPAKVMMVCGVPILATPTFLFDYWWVPSPTGT